MYPSYLRSIHCFQFYGLLRWKKKIDLFVLDHFGIVCILKQTRSKQSNSQETKAGVGIANENVKME